MHNHRIHNPRTTHPATSRSCLAFATQRAATLLLVFAALLWSLPAAAQQPQSSSTRNLSGRVTDEGHEPLRGAIVNLQNPATQSVTTYITQANGEYQFKRLDGSVDYRVWATFRGHSSSVSTISKFDSNMEKVINFKIKPY
jgi:hypothetical protein